MITNNFLLTKVNDYYRQKQSEQAQNEYVLNERLLSDNDYKSVHFALNRAIFDLEKAKYNSTGDLKSLNEKVESLKKKKVESFKRLTSNIQTPQPDCKSCADTATLPSGKTCHCFFERLTQISYDFLKITPTKLVSFIDDTKSEQIGYGSIFEKYKRYCNGFTNQSKNLLFCGYAGTGKTFLAQAIANEIAKKNVNVMYFSTFDFNKVLLDYHLANSFDKSVYFDILTTSDLLVIDDLGCEPIYKNVTIEYFLSVLSQRIILKKPIIITTNLSPEKLLERYGERIYSRLCSNNTVRQFFSGNDLRK